MPDVPRYSWDKQLLRCGYCPGADRPVVNYELYDANDHIVVGCATCRSCHRRHLFTRYLTSSEAAVPQSQGKPMRCEMRKTA